MPTFDVECEGRMVLFGGHPVKYVLAMNCCVMTDAGDCLPTFSTFMRVTFTLRTLHHLNNETVITTLYGYIYGFRRIRLVIF